MLLTRKRTIAFPDLVDLSLFPFVEPVIRIEEYHKDDQYVVKAEIPGVDPAKDIAITTEDGLLRLSVVRVEETKESGRTEFRYGTFHRTVALPPGAKEDSICACYANGILEITMKLGDPAHAGRAIPVTVANGQPKPIKKS
jgi:HSP20 family protein